ncbi:MAG TPA: PVC-type heme-binding CxxCH protein [Pirellulales bacterium]|jgi:putative membrane-bound dehydrogenase-like protein|nr:PVC-type heme-binding CxxCH protein [Pirellulales bacterium]
MNRFTTIAIASGCVLCAQAVFAAEIVKNTGDRPLPPQVAAGHMTVPDGFEVTLFAGEPDVMQPIGFTTDDRGRLWVGECYSYPNWAAEGHDRVLIFSDKQDMGHFDTRKVFSDQVANLTGLEIGFAGVWLCSPPKLLFIPTGGGDSPRGAPVTMLDGWSLKGKHNIVNGLVWGPDGWLYGCNGITSPSLVGKPGTTDAEREAQTGGVWRYHPTKHVFESVARGTTNPWGLDFDDYGQAFITNCVIGHLWHVVPGARYKRMHGVDDNPYSFELLDATSDHLHWGGGDWTTSRGGLGIHSEAGGGHAHAGAMVYLGDNWPDRYRDSIFMCNIHGNRVNNDLLERSGSSYVGRHGKDFLFANDVWFRGLNLKYGPDGGVYVSDWCDNGECHNVAQTDRTSGRMYKIVYGRPNPLPADLDLTKLTDGELVKLQLHKNDWYVRHGRRILQERAAAGRDMTAVNAELHRMFDAEASVPRKLRALWALHVTDGLMPAFLVEQLHHESEYIRAWAIQFLVEDKHPSAAACGEFARMARKDSSAFVRLYLAAALQRMPVDQRWPIAAGLAAHGEDAGDHDLPLMIWYGIEPAIAADPKLGLELVRQCRISLVRRFIARRIALIDDPKRAAGAMATLVKGLGWGTDPAAQFDLLSGMHDALRGKRNETAPDGWIEVYSKLSNSPSAEVRGESDALALIFGDRAALESLTRTAADSAAPLAKRQQAVDVLVEAHVTGLAAALQELLDDPSLLLRALQGLAAYDDPRTPPLILSRYRRLSADQKHEAINTLVARPSYVLALLDAIERKEIPSSDVSLLAARQMQHFKNRQINDKLAKVWGTLRDSSADTKEQLQKYKNLLTPEFMTTADAAAGRFVFSNTCMACHSLYGAGGKIGPDLTGANRGNIDYVLQKVVDPSAAVPNDYQMQLITLKDGRLVSGIIRQRSPRAVVVQTETELLTLSTDDVDEMKSSGQSMMPERQLDKLRPEQIRDLFAYLATKTQVPLPMEK